MRSFFLFLWETGKVIILALLIVVPIRMFVFQPFLVRGESMEPNFHQGDYLVIDELSFRFRDPERGEVIVLKFPGNISQRYIKRIIGLPGETVKVQDGKVTVLKDEKEVVLNESGYLPSGVETPGAATATLKDNEYFMMGDNRPFSSDSRQWGVLSKNLIVGRVLLRLFPPNVIAKIQEPSY